MPGQQKLNPKVNYGLWMIMICQYRFILGKRKKNVPLWGVMLIMGEARDVWGTGATWEISVPLFQFCCKPKTTPKIVFEKERKKINSGRTLRHDSSPLYDFD